MNDDDDTDGGEMSDEEIRSFAPTPWALKEGLMVVVNGEPRFTPKGMVAIRALMESKGLIPKRH